MSEKQDYFQPAIDWAKSLRLNNIKANYEGYESPRTFNRAEDDKDISFVPDITGRKRTNKFYVEIAMKADNTRKMVSKWKLLSTLASMKGGKLYLLAPRGHKAFVQRLLDRYQLPNAEVVYLKA
jgi:hypothetical protein